MPLLPQVAKIRERIDPEHRCREECEYCPFGGPRVGSKGNVDSPLVVVGESPGREECKTGIPFAGDSGQLMHMFLTEDAYVLNAMECSPPKKQKGPQTLKQAARACNSRLVQLIQKKPRKLIVALGNAAVWSLTGDYNLKITQIRGRLIPSPLAELGILPMVHPAALMRGTGNFRQWKEDMAYAMDLLNGGKPKEYTKPKWVTVKPGRKAVNKAMRRLLGKSLELTCDIETDGFNHRKDKILSIGICDPRADRVFCFKPEHIPYLQPFLESQRIKWCWHNGKFDIRFFHTQHSIAARVDDDTMLLSYCLDERTGVHDLETVSTDVLGAPDYKHMLKPYLPRKDSPYSLIPEPVLHEYMADDVARTAKIRTIYRERVRRDPALEKLYTKTLIPASKLLAEVEKTGIYVDREWMEDAGEVLLSDMEALKQEIQEICGRDVNPGSFQQMSEVLFKQFRLPNFKEGSTDKDVLKRLMENDRTRHPVVIALSKYRVLAKAYGTYIKGLRKWVQDDGRVYGTYLLHGTVTGRLASRKPNLQNIPRDFILRGIFTGAPGYDLLEVDLSQAELRSLAALSGDPALVEVYLAGRSIHKELAVYLFGEQWKYNYAQDEGSPEYQKAYEQYTRCKNVNFGIIYGVTKYGLADQIGTSTLVAQQYIDGWAKRFPVAWEFIQKCRSAPTKGWTLTTTFGRKKRTGLVTRENINFLRNEAANFPHQSIASDITLHAAMRSYEGIRRLGGRIVNLVHDSIIMEVPAGDEFARRRIAQLVMHEMQQVPKDWGITRVPFVAEAEVGDRWGLLEKYDVESESVA